MRKMIVLFIMLAFLLPTVTITGDASTYNEEKVFDYADLLTTEEENSLKDHAEMFEKYELSVVYLTISDALGKTSQEYADEFYDDHHYHEDGVLFLINMNNREMYISTAGRSIDILTDEMLDGILDDSYQYAVGGRYYDCLKEMGRQTCLILENNINVPLGIHRTALVAVPLGLIIGVIVLVVLFIFHVSVAKRKNADNYIMSGVQVSNKHIVLLRSWDNVIRDYYKKETTTTTTSRSSFGGSSSSRSGGSRHTSSRGVSHGGRGRKF